MKKRAVTIATGALVLAGTTAALVAQERVGVDDPVLQRADLRALSELLAKDPEFDLEEVVKSLPTPAELAGQRAEVADRMVRLSLVQLALPPSPSDARGAYASALANYLQWSELRLTDRLETLEADDARREAIAGEVVQLRELEKLATQLARAVGSPLSESDLLQLRYQRLLMETRLSGLSGTP